jgi:hypothetical protein
LYSLPRARIDNLTRAKQVRQSHTILITLPDLATCAPTPIAFERGSIQRVNPHVPACRRLLA